MTIKSSIGTLSLFMGILGSFNKLIWYCGKSDNTLIRFILVESFVNNCEILVYVADWCPY